MAFCHVVSLASNALAMSNLLRTSPTLLQANRHDTLTCNHNLVIQKLRSAHATYHRVSLEDDAVLLDLGGVSSRRVLAQSE